MRRAREMPAGANVAGSGGSVHGSVHGSPRVVARCGPPRAAEGACAGIVEGSSSGGGTKRRGRGRPRRPRCRCTARGRRGRCGEGARSRNEECPVRGGLARPGAGAALVVRARGRRAGPAAPRPHEARRHPLAQLAVELADDVHRVRALAHDPTDLPTSLVHVALGDVGRAVGDLVRPVPVQPLQLAARVVALCGGALRARGELPRPPPGPSRQGRARRCLRRSIRLCYSRSLTPAGRISGSQTEADSDVARRRTQPPSPARRSRRAGRGARSSSSSSLSLLGMTERLRLFRARGGACPRRSPPRAPELSDSATSRLPAPAPVPRRRPRGLPRRRARIRRGRLERRAPRAGRVPVGVRRSTSARSEASSGVSAAPRARSRHAVRAAVEEPPGAAERPASVPVPLEAVQRGPRSQHSAVRRRAPRKSRAAAGRGAGCGADARRAEARHLQHPDGLVEGPRGRVELAERRAGVPESRHLASRGAGLGGGRGRGGAGDGAMSDATSGAEVAPVAEQLDPEPVGRARSLARPKSTIRPARARARRGSATRPAAISPRPRLKRDWPGRVLPPPGWASRTA